MGLGIDIPFGLDELDKVFEVADFLENKEELVNEFKPEVQKLIVKKDFFTGAFRRAYLDAFDDLIVRLIRAQIIKHFNYSPEEVVLLTDKQFLKMITNNFYFDQNNYITKEGKNESERSNSLQ